MTISLIGLLVALCSIGLIWWAITTLLGAFSVPAPLATVIKVLFVVVVVLWLLSIVGGLGSHIQFH